MSNMPYCGDFGCNNQTGKNKSFYQIPHPQKERNRTGYWINSRVNNIFSFNNFILSKYQCRDHFHPGYVQRDM